jgi:hypothetical protein
MLPERLDEASASDRRYTVFRGSLLCKGWRRSVSAGTVTVSADSGENYALPSFANQLPPRRLLSSGCLIVASVVREGQVDCKLHLSCPDYCTTQVNAVV